MLVRKFGGTSMGSRESLFAVAKIIKAYKGKQAVVVSAMSGVTSDLIAATEATLAGKQLLVKDILAKLQEKHIAIIGVTIQDESIQAKVAHYTECVVKSLGGFLKALGEIGELSHRSEDTILAVGERLSAYLLAGILSDQGLPAEQLDFEKALPDNLSEKADRDFYLKAEKIFAQRVKKVIARKKIPVITGYFGRVPGGMLPAVGRGYSDFCAALVAAGLKATNLEIWTDVSGIYTADPRKVKKAFVIKTISNEAAAELAHFGAKVLHPQSVHPATRARIPVWIKNTFEPAAYGTKIIPEVKNPERLMTSITCQKGVTIVNIASYRMLLQHGFMAKVFNTFAKYEIPVDVVTTSEVSISLTVSNTKYLEEVKEELRPISKITIIPKKAIVCLVSLGMKNQHGVAGEVFSTLGKAGISVEMISQGASEINITFVVDETEADKAVMILHEKFFENGYLPKSKGI
ncbi:MAG: aspartate kinase [Candidatus Gracilibacteria bacterium]